MLIVLVTLFNCEFILWDFLFILLYIKAKIISLRKLKVILENFLFIQFCQNNTISYFIMEKNKKLIKILF